VTCSREERDRNHAQPERLESLVYRYPYLYQHYILDSHSNELGRKAVKRMQLEREIKFEQDLLFYTPNLFQTSEIACQSTLQVKVKNPTLLNDCQLKDAVSQFVGTSKVPAPIEMQPSNSFMRRQVHHRI
jgi:hypothetical protein